MADNRSDEEIIFDLLIQVVDRFNRLELLAGGLEIDTVVSFPDHQTHGGRLAHGIFHSQGRDIIFREDHPIGNRWSLK